MFWQLRPSPLVSNLVRGAVVIKGRDGAIIFQSMDNFSFKDPNSIICLPCSFLLHQEWQKELELEESLKRFQEDRRLR